MATEMILWRIWLSRNHLGRYRPRRNVAPIMAIGGPGEAFTIWSQMSTVASVLHCIARVSIHVFDIRQAESMTTVRRSGQDQNGYLCGFGGIELYYSSPLGTSVCVVPDIHTLDLADEGEKLDQVFVACRSRM